MRLGYAPQVNIVRQDGQRAALLTVLKNGETSTLDIVKGVKELLPQVKAGLPPSLQITPLFDQSIFVSESINEVVRRSRNRSCADRADDPAISSARGVPR